MVLERWIEAADDRGGPCRRRKDAESKEKEEVSPLQLDCEKSLWNRKIFEPVKLGHAACGEEQKREIFDQI